MKAHFRLVQMRRQRLQNAPCLFSPIRIPTGRFTRLRAHAPNGAILAVDQARGEFADAFDRPLEVCGLAGEDKATEFGKSMEGCGWRAFASMERIPGQYSAQDQECIESEQYFCCFALDQAGRMQPK